MGIKVVNIYDEFFRIGGNSLLALELLSKIKREFNIEVPLTSLSESSTIDSLSVIVRSGINIKEYLPNKSLVSLNDKGNRCPIYLVHPAGGYCFIYNDLVQLLPTEQPVYGLQIKDSEYKTVKEIAASYVKEIISFQPEGPYILGGLSFGGLVSYEMANQLCSLGHKVSLLIMFDTMFPNQNMIDESSYLAPYMTRFNLDDQQLKKFFANDYITQLRIILELGKKENYLTKDVTEEQLNRILNVWINHSKATASYLPKRILPVPIVFFEAKDENRDISSEWEKFTSSRFQVFRVPGDHNSLMKNIKSVEVVADLLKKELEKL